MFYYAQNSSTSCIDSKEKTKFNTRIYDLINQHGLDTPYNQAVAFLEFMQEELKFFIANVQKYKLKQNNLFFNYSRMSLPIKILLPPVVLSWEGAFVYLIFDKENLIRNILLWIIYTIAVCALSVLLDKNLANQPLDKISRAYLKKIEEKKTLLSFLKIDNESVTQNDINFSLEEMKKDFQSLITHLTNYCYNLNTLSDLSSEAITSVELSEKEDEILQFMFNKWLEKNSESNAKQRDAHQSSLELKFS